METNPLTSADFWLTHQLEARYFFVSPYIHKGNKYTPEVKGDYLMVIDDNKEPSFHHVNTFSETRNKYFNIIEK